MNSQVRQAIASLPPSNIANIPQSPVDLRVWSKHVQWQRCKPIADKIVARLHKKRGCYKEHDVGYWLKHNKTHVDSSDFHFILDLCNS